MKKLSLLFLALSLLCALLLSGCTSRLDGEDGRVSDSPDSSPSLSLSPSPSGGESRDGRDDPASGAPFGALLPGGEEPSSSPSTNPSGSATPSATE